MLRDDIERDLAGLFGRAWDSHGMQVLDLAPAQLLPLVTQLHADFGFDLLLDITAIDHPQRTPRFDVVLHLLASRHRTRIRLKTQVAEASPVLPTLTGLYGAARFLEREAHEMFGISFAGHPDLRNMYLPSDFEGHPLRKDFPLLARMVKPWPGIVDVEPLPGGEGGDES